LAFAALVGFGSGAEGEPRIVTFNLASGCDTEPVAINAKGTIIGNSYTDGEFCSAFERLRGGTFVYPREPVLAMNKEGEITGNNRAGLPYLRRADGSEITFSLHIDGHKRESLVAVAINSRGTIAGHYSYLLKGPPRRGGTLGFLRTRNGTITTFGCPDSTSGTWIIGTNDLGATVSRFGSSPMKGCIHNPDGTSTVFDAGGDTFPTAINDAGYVTGLVDLHGVGQKGFVRAPDGTITLFDGYPHSINAAGTITGEYGVFDGVYQGFVRAADGTITLFNVDSATYTRPVSINDRGIITGAFGGNNNYQGFIRFP